MKRLLTFILALALLLNAGGQILRYSNYTTPTPPAEVDSASWHADYKEVYYAMTTRPGIDTANLQNILVASLDTLSDGATSAWDRMDLFYLFAQRSNAAGEAYINWKNPGTFDLTDPGSTNPTFTVYEGLTGAATTKYLTTGYIPGTHASKMSLNSATIASYTRTNNGANAAMGTSPLRIYPDAASGQTSFLNSSSSMANVVANGTGFAMGTRRGETETEQYKNGVSLGTDTDASSSLSGYAIFVLAYNNLGTASATYDGQVSLVFLMDAVSDTEAANINTVIETYMDAIGKGVE